MNNKDLFQKYNDRHWEFHPTKYAEEFSEFLKNKNFAGLIIDAGCGTGRDVNVFYKNGFNVLGIDNSKEEIKKAKEKYPNCKFQERDIETLDLKDVGAFFMINVIHYVNAEKALNSIFNYLKKGRFLFIHFNLMIIDEQGNIDYEQKEEEINKLISKFEIIQKEFIERVDLKPKKHKHKILQFILQRR